MKISIIGAGNVGGSCTNILAISGIVDEIVLLDSKSGYAEGKSMDINQGVTALGKGTYVTASSSYGKVTDSDIIVVAAGAKRTAEMTREDLLQINAKIIESIFSQCLKHAPNAIFIVATNPLDSMVYKAISVSKLSRNKIIGMAGMLDTSRYITMLSQALNINPNNIKTTIVGPHNDDMIILKRYTTVNGVPVLKFIDDKDLNDIIDKTKNSGKSIIELSGTSAYYAPAASLFKMVEAIVFDTNTVITASVLLKGEYNIYDCCIGVPVVIGKKGVIEVIDIELEKSEKALLQKCVEDLKPSQRDLLHKHISKK